MSPRGVGPVAASEIVRATIRCLARDGARTHDEEDRREAGVSQGILHYYFADKRAILVAALRDGHGRPRRRAVAVARRARPEGPRPRAGRGVCAGGARSARSGSCSWSSGGEMHDRPLGEVNAALYDRIRRLIGAWSRTGVRAGRVPPGRSSSGGRRDPGLVDGVSLQLTFDPGVFSVAVATRFCGGCGRGATSRGRPHDDSRRGAGEGMRVFQDEGHGAPGLDDPRARRGCARVVRGIRAPAVGDPGGPGRRSATSGRFRRSWTTSSRPTAPGSTSCGVPRRTASAGRADPGEPPPQGTAPQALALAPRRAHAPSNAEVLKTLGAVRADFTTDARAPIDGRQRDRRGRRHDAAALDRGPRLEGVRDRQLAASMPSIT